MDTQIYTRSLGKVEFLYWLYDKVSCANFVIICSFTRELDPARLQSEIAGLAAQHPALQLQFVRIDRKHLVLSNQSGTEFRLTTRSGSADDIRIMVEEQLNTRFGEQEMPLFRAAYWTQGSDHPPTVLFTFHH
ncbi:MAG: hypothetical protein NTZ34_09970, partial [Chloroflexi bacterium]|nr:hypothetical protein [Chloroflexota bacterium]